MKRELKVLVNTKRSEGFINKYPIHSMNLEQAGYISSIVKKILQEKGVNKSIIRRVCIATYEAEINVVIHSFGGICELYCDNETLKLIFSDIGPGITNIEEAMKEGYSTASVFAIQNGFGAGMGLPNIRKTADVFNIESSEKGTILNIEFNLK